MEVAEVATIRFDGEVSDASKCRIVRAIANMNPPGADVVVVTAPGLEPLVVVGKQWYCDTLRDDIRRHMQGQRHA